MVAGNDVIAVASVVAIMALDDAIAMVQMGTNVGKPKGHL